LQPVQETPINKKKKRKKKKKKKRGKKGKRDNSEKTMAQKQSDSDEFGDTIEVLGVVSLSFGGEIMALQMLDHELDRTFRLLHAQMRNQRSQDPGNLPNK
jgi:hypothetical protein